MKFQLSRIVILFVLFAGVAAAQSMNASISGTVTDPSGAVVPGAEVTLKSLERQTTAKTTTSADGLYSFPNLEPGSYEVSVKAAGFKPLTQTGITLVLSQVARADLKLDVGTDVQTVEVQANASQLNYENAVHQ